MTNQFLIRTGAFGDLYRCRATDAAVYRRSQRVICRTPRGLEVGTVVAAVPSTAGAEGEILRATSSEDELLVDRLQRYKQQAVVACQQQMQSECPGTVLLEVDHLFDGRTLIFFFLGPVDDRLQKLAERLADQYERNVRTRHFAKLLAQGCGPGCGTEEKGGCQGGCAVCVVAAACATRT